jgi:hypothetical protein
MAAICAGYSFSATDHRTSATDHRIRAAVPNARPQRDTGG